MSKKHTPLVLIVLDGWGYREATKNNAIKAANTPCWDKLWQNYPHTLINGSGEAVGLPDGQMGNSEVGHMNIGMGRVVYQDFTRINHAIDTGEFNTNTVLNELCDTVNKHTGVLHILGLFSPGGVHSHELQIKAMIELAIKKQVKHIYLHAFLDGRDTPPKSAMASINAFETLSNQNPQFQIASLIGRYYAMDRDKRWERVEKAYNLLTEGVCEYSATTASAALESAYQNNETDEFVKPCSIHAENQPAITINDGDGVIYMNFRSDRARALTQAFTLPDFDGFQRDKQPQLSEFVTLTQYDKTFTAPIAFPPASMKNGLGEVLAERNYTQLRIAETEKYAHVTFFFNGGIEQAYPHEQRILIPSPKVATYDLKPEMSAIEVTDVLVAHITANTENVIICNFANPDMVGHTGNFDATVKAIETIDHCLERIVNALEKVGGELLITADHGNAECMFNEETGQPHTAHTSDPVPLVYVGRKADFISKDGILADIAPTMLYLLDEKIPDDMTGHNLLMLKE